MKTRSGANCCQIYCLYPRIQALFINLSYPSPCLDMRLVRSQSWGFV